MARVGWSLVFATLGTMLVTAVALLVGANLVGLVALATIGVCGWTLVIAETVCRHRIGLTPEHLLDEPWGGDRWRDFEN